MVLLGIDGDFACNKNCEQAYEVGKAHFFNNIVHDEAKCTKWLMGYSYMDESGSMVNVEIKD